MSNNHLSLVAPQEHITCSSCGKQIFRDANGNWPDFCGDCGNQLFTTCPHCQAEVTSGFRYCDNCEKLLPLENGVVEDIRNGSGFCLLDTHGNVLHRVIESMPKRRLKDVIYLFPDNHLPFGLNIFEHPHAKSVLEVNKSAGYILDTLKTVLRLDHDQGKFVGSLMNEQILRHCIYTLLYNPRYTLAEIPLFLVDRHFREELLQQVPKHQYRPTHGFWEEQYTFQVEEDQRTDPGSLFHAVEDLLDNMTIKRIIGQSDTTIDFEALVTGRKILLINFEGSKKKLITLVGEMIIQRIVETAVAHTSGRNTSSGFFASVQW